MVELGSCFFQMLLDNLDLATKAFSIADCAFAREGNEKRGMESAIAIRAVLRICIFNPVKETVDHTIKILTALVETTLRTILLKQIAVT